MKNVSFIAFVTSLGGVIVLGTIRQLLIKESRKIQSGSTFEAMARYNANALGLIVSVLLFFCAASLVTYHFSND